MHKFQPRIYLVRRREGEASQPVRDIQQELFRTFIFHETQFTAVTAYQNQLVR
jgi:T-box protein 20